MDRRQRRCRRDNERGAVLVMVGVGLLALIVAVALVVDLGLARHVRRSNQSATDLAALAAGEALGSDPMPDGRTACADAVDYLIANVGAISSSVSVPCNTLPSSCDSTTGPVTVTDGGTAGNYVINITYPVADSTIADNKVASASSLRLNDGLPCERMRVSLTNQFDSLFSGVLGNQSLSVSADATVRQIQASDRRVPSLWLLEPTGCNALVATGGSTVEVGTTSTAGLVTLDSDGSTCTGNSFTIDSGGSGSFITSVSGDPTQDAEISLVAMERLQATCSTGNLHACDPADVPFNVSPQPVRRASRATRAPVDHMYNCKTSYPDYHGVSIDGCTAGTGPYIDNLVTGVGTSGTPTGFQQWTDSYNCNNPTLPAGGVDGNWHVDCPNFRVSSADVSFKSGNVVFDGNISLTGGSLNFNTANPISNLPSSCLTAVVGCLTNSSSNSAWVVMRAGDLSLTGGALNANSTLIYQESGDFSVAGGSPPVWTSPTEGPFAGLAVWSELASNKFKINGGASMELQGTFFTPEANSLNISGGAPVIPQQAQFVSRRLTVSGGASLTLSPNASLGVAIPADPPLLIR